MCGVGWIAVGAFALLLSTFSNAQRITTRGRQVEAMEGTNVELNCNIEDNTNDAAVVWKRGGQPIFIDEDLVSGDSRLELHREGMNFTLIINHLEPIDAAHYECGITDPEMYITHTLKVLVRPAVTISPDVDPYQVNVDENVVMKCSSSGNPLPSVRWTLRVGHAGTYECIANSSVGSTSATITLVVNEPNGSKNKTAPWVETDRQYISTTVNSSVNVTCRYDGEPIPQVEWLFNGYRLNVADERFRKTVQFGQRLANSTETTLQITGMTEDSFGDYTCRISNNVGTVQDTIHVSGRPGPPVLTLAGGRLTWTVQSKDQLIECRVHHRFAQEDTFQDYQIVRIDKSDREGDLWEHSVDLLPFLPAGHTYEIQVDCRNDLGWGSLARDYVTVAIKDDAPPPSSLSLLLSPMFVIAVPALLGVLRL